MLQAHQMVMLTGRSTLQVKKKITMMSTMRRMKVMVRKMTISTGKEMGTLQTQKSVQQSARTTSREKATTEDNERNQLSPETSHSTRETSALPS
jgi:hypothetical protein